MQHTRAEYKLRHFRTSTTPGFAEALKLYSESFPASLKTSTNEITYWLDHPLLLGDDKFLVFGFYANKKLVGYAQLAYFRAECILAVDYLVVDRNHRRDNVFFEFLEHLRVAIRSSDLQVDYVVAEVALESSHHREDDRTPYLLRLLRYIGFGIAQAAYYQPQLGAENYESKTVAALAVSTTGDFALEKIRTETYLRLVRTLYYNHYLRWYSIYTNHTDVYKRHLDDTFEQVKRSVARQQYVTINGHPIQATPETVVKLEDNRILRFAVLALSIVVALTVLLFSTTRFFQVSIGVVLPVYLLALISIFAVFSMLSKEARPVFRELIKILFSWSKTK